MKDIKRSRLNSQETQLGSQRIVFIESTLFLIFVYSIDDFP
jgi:hypothetical protein